MHRLVQFSTRTWLELHGELAHWQGRYIRIFDAAFPTRDYVNWLTCQALFPHVEVMLSYKTVSDYDLYQRAATFYRGAWYASENGRYGVAREMARASLEDRERLLGLTDIHTLDSADDLVAVLQGQRKYEQGEQMNRWALVGREKELGTSHPNTLMSVYCLADLLHA